MSLRFFALFAPLSERSERAVKKRQFSVISGPRTSVSEWVVQNYNSPQRHRGRQKELQIPNHKSTNSKQTPKIKFQIPSVKFQTSSNIQNNNIQTKEKSKDRLIIDYWDLIIVWNLVLVTWLLVVLIIVWNLVLGTWLLVVWLLVVWKTARDPSLALGRTSPISSFLHGPRRVAHHRDPRRHVPGHHRAHAHHCAAADHQGPAGPPLPDQHRLHPSRGSIKGHGIYPKVL